MSPRIPANKHRSAIATSRVNGCALLGRGRRKGGRVARVPAGDALRVRDADGRGLRQGDGRPAMTLEDGRTALITATARPALSDGL